MGLWVNGPGARRGRRVMFALDEFMAWDLALRIRRLPPEYLDQVASFVAACEIARMIDTCEAPDAVPPTIPPSRVVSAGPPGR